MKYTVLIFLSIFCLSASATTKEDVSQKTSEAAEAAAAYTKAQKEEFQKSMEAKIAELNAELVELKQASAEKSQTVKDETLKKIKNLEAKKETLQKDLAKMKTRSGKAWTEMKSGVSQAWDSLKASYAKAKEEMNSKE